MFMRSRRARFPKIDIVVIASGVLSINGVELTKEGVDRQMAVIYYGSRAFVNGLLPSQRAAQAGGEDARAMVVLNVGAGTPLDLDDMGLKRGPASGISGSGRALLS